MTYTISEIIWLFRRRKITHKKIPACPQTLTAPEGFVLILGSQTKTLQVSHLRDKRSWEPRKSFNMSLSLEALCCNWPFPNPQSTVATSANFQLHILAFQVLQDIVYLDRVLQQRRLHSACLHCGALIINKFNLIFLKNSKCVIFHNSFFAIFVRLITHLNV